jgi:hypothetical protein
VSGLFLESNVCSALAERRGKKSDCDHGANKFVILVVSFVAVMLHGSVLKACFLDHFLCLLVNLKFSSDDFLTSSFPVMTF